MYLFFDTSDFQKLLVFVVNEKGVGVRKKLLRGARGRRERFLAAVATLLQEVRLKPKDLKGVLVVEGPGSFSSLRLGVSVANAFATDLRIPLAPVAESEVYNFTHMLRDARWLPAGQTMTPKYGKEPNITKPKKAV